jgi:hypothetical protein
LALFFLLILADFTIRIQIQEANRMRIECVSRTLALADPFEINVGHWHCSTVDICMPELYLGPEKVTAYKFNNVHTKIEFFAE